MIQIEANLRGEGREVVLTLDDEGVSQLDDALNEVQKGNEVFLGEYGAMLIVRPENWAPAE